MKIETDISINESERLPAQLVIRKGRIVEAATGRPPKFPDSINGIKCEGLVVSVVPRDDLAKVMKRSAERRAILENIRTALSAIYPDEPKTKT